MNKPFQYSMGTLFRVVVLVCLSAWLTQAVSQRSSAISPDTDLFMAIAIVAVVAVHLFVSRREP